MIEQVELDDGQILKAMTEHRNTTELIMILKGYVIGYLGIPLNHCKMSDLLGMIDLYQDWVEMGTFSPINLINIFLHPLKSIKSFHNRSCSIQDQTHCIQVIQDKVEYLVQRVMQDEKYFQQTTPSVYNPKQAIRQILNMTQNECTICTVNMNPEQVMILDCTHVYHFECLIHHVSHSIQNGQIYVKCPNEYCGMQMANEEIQNFMTPELQKKRSDYMMNQYIEKNGGNTSWCPTPDCNLMFEFDAQVTDFSCRNCHQRYCLKCRCDFHHNMTCKENQQFRGMNSQDQSFVTFARGAKFKQCPRCKFWVEKLAGCVSMKCRCNQEFCYECGGVTCPHGRCSTNNTQMRANPSYNRRN